ncbi:MAG: FixH family protein [Bacteroidota bacterium]
MNWGKGIIIGMSAFVAFISVLVTIIMSNRVDLVSDDYYRKEIAYESEIAAKNAWDDEGGVLHFASDSAHLIVSLPQIDGVDSYELSLERPDDRKRDMSFTIAQTQTFLVKKSSLVNGMYTYRISCRKSGKNLVNTGQYYVK